MRLDVHDIEATKSKYIICDHYVYDKDSNMPIDYCVWADDETGEYGVYDKYTPEEMLNNYQTSISEDGVEKPKLFTIKCDVKGDPIILAKKGNIEFRKWDEERK